MGVVHSYGDNVDTDVIIPARYLTTSDPAKLAAHALEYLDPDFAPGVRAGDVVVAGHNFGCGSSREHAPIALTGAGVSAVVAKSFARIFFRNAINIGLLLLSVDATDVVEGDLLTYDGERLRVPARDIVLTPAPIPADVRAIVDAGGLLALVRAGGFR